ncbi:MAG: hypothetical protein M3R01_06635, partial [Actinomycetota bacterium]|nr:hypothetical protein [Actinomycetota bacterium]
MKALVASPGAPGDIALADVDDPVAGDEEALVAVKAVSLNRGEVRALATAEVVVGMPTSGEYECILESVGGASMAAALGLVAPGGMVVSYGSSSREPTTFDVS